MVEMRSTSIISQTVMPLLNLSYDPVNFIRLTQPNIMLLVRTFWELLCLQDRLWESYLNVDMWIEQAFILMEEILKDTLCNHSRTELSVWTYSLFIDSDKLGHLFFPRNHREDCIVLFFWYNKAWMKVKFCRCYQLINILISVEFWSYFSSWFQLMLLWRAFREV